MTNFDTEYKRLNHAQKEAVDYIDGPLLVVAGPGTGKTQLLSLRVANILKRTDVQPYNILCLTYTESGKETMISRLTHFLGKIGKNVEVNTFHGFGTRLITRFPDYFPELANFRPAEDLTLYETLRSCLVKLPRSNPLSKQAYGQFTYQQDVRERISQLKRAGILPNAALNKVKLDAEWCKKNGRKLCEAFQSVGRLTPKAIVELANKLEPLFANETESGLGRTCQNELRESLTASQNTNKTAPLSDFKKKWLISEDGQLHFKANDQIKKIVALAELYIAYEAELKKRRLYDYDDMILYALEKLKNNSEFLALVQETFQYILADEYQDTNAAQASIINLIADNPVNEGRPNVMVVGDDDQAIYGFQGALGDVLMDFRERWQNVKVITLTENYRSNPSILNTARSIITQGQNRLENFYEDIDKTLNSQSDVADTQPSVYEAASVEAVIDKAVSVAKSSDDQRQLAIIATKHKYLIDLANRLDAAKVSYYYEGRADLLSDEQIYKLLLIADTVLSIKQKDFVRTNYILPEIIAIGAMQIPKTVAWRLALDAKNNKLSWWEVMASSKDKDVKSAVKTFKHLALLIIKKDAEDSLKIIARNRHLRVIQKIKRLTSHASSYFGRDNVGLSELLNYTNLCKQAGVSIDKTIVRGNDQAQVVLLSAHKSKGLEFDRVFVLHADYQTWFKERGRRNNLVLPQNWQSIEPLATNKDDRLRLLYVVLTRAKQELAFIKIGSSPSINSLEEIKAEQYVSEKLESFELPESVEWRSWFMPKSANERVELKNLLQPTLNKYRLSPTHLTLFLDVPHDGPTTFLTKVLLGIPEQVHPEAVFGSHVHRAIKFAQDYLNETGKLPVKSDLEQFVKKQNLKDEIWVADIVQVVTEFLKSDNTIRPGGVSEYSFSKQNIEFESMQLTGTVDHFIVKQNEITITDFKTGRAINSWRVREDYYRQKLHRFRQQLLFYELLFELSNDFRANNFLSKVVFVEPTRRDVYCELTLDADKTERQKFESLIAVVWQNIVDLVLPDISSYSKDMHGIETFESSLLDSK